ncbi:MAG: hypothetical protein QOF51_3751 [Chloroflexota bacterium]|nr:hypothetical protein [Chloroflexota bacterium]
MEANEDKRQAQTELTAEEIEAGEALLLPERDALSLLDPSQLTGHLIGGGPALPSPTDPLGGQPAAAGPAPAPAPPDGLNLAGQSTTQSSTLANHLLPAPDPSAPYDPSSSSSSST